MMKPPRRPGEKESPDGLLIIAGGGPPRPKMDDEDSGPPMKSAKSDAGSMHCPNCGCPLTLTPQMDEEEPEEMGEEPEYKEAS